MTKEDVEKLVEKVKALTRYDPDMEYGYSDASWAVMEENTHGDYVRLADLLALFKED